MIVRKQLFYIIMVFIILTITSCSSNKNSVRSEKQALKEMEKRQNKATDELVKKYDKMYKDQTNRQAKDQKKMIKKSRRNPKHMRGHERKFFLWRWLGI